MVKKLEAVGANALMQETFPPLQWFAEDLIGPGCYVLASIPKAGKSLLCLALGLAVTSGQPFLEHFETHKAGVCILAVEDRLRRIQARLWQITDEASDELRFAERAERLDSGLIEQLAMDLQEHPNTGIYVVDTYAAVRTPGTDYAYQSDYDDLRMFADFADEHGVCVLVCHHCRKSMSLTSPFLDISGTTGLTGAVTGMIVLHDKVDAGGKKAGDVTIMSVEGKDVAKGDFELQLEGCAWKMLGPISQDELKAATIPECIHATIAFMAAREAPWQGSSAELMRAVGLEGIRPDVFGKYLAQHRGYMARKGVAYERRHTRDGNVLELAPIAPEEA